MYEYPEGKAVLKWGETSGRVSFSIVKTERGHYCGYARFKRRPVREEGYSGILTYVPVHGGITYAAQDKDGSIAYGFDCAHCDDESNPELQDIKWLRAECERMALGIQIAAKFEKRYLLAADGKAKATVLDCYHKAMRARGADFKLTDNFGAMIGVLSGSL